MSMMSHLEDQWQERPKSRQMDQDIFFFKLKNTLLLKKMRSSHLKAQVGSVKKIKKKMLWEYRLQRVMGRNVERRGITKALLSYFIERTGFKCKPIHSIHIYCAQVVCQPPICIPGSGERERAQVQSQLYNSQSSSQSHRARHLN